MDGKEYAEIMVLWTLALEVGLDIIKLHFMAVGKSKNKNIRSGSQSTPCKNNNELKEQTDNG